MPKLSEVFYPNLKEDLDMTKKASTQAPAYSFGIEAVRDLVDKSNGRLKYSGSKRGSYRISRTDPKVEVPADEIKKILDKINCKVIQIIPPGAPRSNSSKFNTYVIRNGEMEFTIVFGQGSNGGHDFERETIQGLKNSQKAARKNKEMGELYKILINSFGLKPEDIEDIVHVGSKRVKRPLLAKPTFVGNEISDVDFELKNGTTIHISLKNRDGRTFANSGYHSAFVEQLDAKGKPVFTVGAHELDDFIVNGCGVNKQKVADGINDYINKRPTKPPYRDVETNFNPDIIKSYLAGAYGYGYWYLRPKMVSQGPGWQLINIGSAEAAYDLVGDVESVLVSYPYWSPTSKSKQVTVKIYTSNAYFNVEIRNSQKRVHPNEIKVRIMKSL